MAIKYAGKKGRMYGIAELQDFYFTVIMDADFGLVT
jgi:hypothetical protein